MNYDESESMAVVFVIIAVVIIASPFISLVLTILYYILKVGFSFAVIFIA